MPSEEAKQLLTDATAAIQSGQFGQAAEIADQAIALDATDPEAFLLKGIALSQLGRGAESVAAFQQSISLDPNSFKAHYNLAVHYYTAGDKAAALRSLQRALAIDPSNGGARDLEHRLAADGFGTPQAPAMGAPTMAPPTMGAPTEGFQNPPQGQALPGYAGYEAHKGVAYVRKMGSAWTGLGFLTVIASLVASILGWMTAYPMFRDMFSDLQAFSKRMKENPHFYDSANKLPIQLFGFLCLGLILYWSITDIYDRKANWFWLIPIAIAPFCCGLGWLALLIYILAGRKPKVSQPGY